MFRLTFLVTLAMALAGCASSPGPSKPAAAAPRAPTETSVGTPSWMKASDYHAGGPVPAMEPNRRISDQDCTHGVELELGNLRCKPAR